MLDHTTSRYETIFEGFATTAIVVDMVSIVETALITEYGLGLSYVMYMQVNKQPKESIALFATPGCRDRQELCMGVTSDSGGICFILSSVRGICSTSPSSVLP